MEKKNNHVERGRWGRMRHKGVEVRSEMIMTVKIYVYIYFIEIYCGG